MITIPFIFVLFCFVSFRFNSFWCLYFYYSFHSEKPIRSGGKMVQSGMPYIVSKINTKTDPTWDLCTFSFSFTSFTFLLSYPILSYSFLFFFFFLQYFKYSVFSYSVLEVISQTIIINTGWDPRFRNEVYLN